MQIGVEELPDVRRVGRRDRELTAAAGTTPDAPFLQENARFFIETLPG
ncbi:MAG: hypothetical protein ACRDQV_12275 [Pseudonocardiaceae bacterium]